MKNILSKIIVSFAVVAIAALGLKVTDNIIATSKASLNETADRCGVNNGYTWNGTECVRYCDINHPWDSYNKRCSNMSNGSIYTYNPNQNPNCQAYGSNYVFNGTYCVSGGSNLNNNVTRYNNYPYNTTTYPVTGTNYPTRTTYYPNTNINQNVNYATNSNYNNYNNYNYTNTNYSNQTNSGYYSSTPNYSSQYYKNGGGTTIKKQVYTIITTTTQGGGTPIYNSGNYNYGWYGNGNNYCNTGCGGNYGYDYYDDYYGQSDLDHYLLAYRFNDYINSYSNYSDYSGYYDIYGNYHR